MDKCKTKINPVIFPCSCSEYFIEGEYAYTYDDTEDTASAKILWTPYNGSYQV
ncbi:MAG: hypothetical protein LUG85_06080 [Clostridiales bacterium]|nr:hypothetical protein [Clostridiales bacterium]